MITITEHILRVAKWSSENWSHKPISNIIPLSKHYNVRKTSNKKKVVYSYIGQTPHKLFCSFLIYDNCFEKW